MSDPQQVSAAARHERLLLRLLIFARTATLCQAAVSLGLTWRQLTEPLLAAALLGLLIAENIILIRGLRRRDGLGRRLLATLDVGLGMAALFAIMAMLKHTAIPDTDNFLYPYTVASMSVIGLVYRRFPAVLLIPTLAAAGYLGATLVRFGPRTTVDLLTNVITYWAWAVASWFVAARFRKLSAELDQARDAAAAREAELARERECSRHQRELHVVQLTMAQRERERTMLSRDLHDHVLQTLEFMGREDWISDTRMRDHVAAEAVWLRELVHSELDRPVTGLTAALDGVVARQTGAGMRIEMNTAGLGTQTLPAEVVGALAGAVTELLTNVRKHAGTTRAVLRAVCSPDLVTVTVLDRGRGFAPIRATSGLGLRESVIARIRQVEGRVMVTSEPNAGTHVELTVPLGRTPAPVPGGPAEPAPSAAIPPAAAEPPAARPAFARSAPGGQRLVMQTQDMPAGAGRCENATTPGMRSLLGQQGLRRHACSPPGTAGRRRRQRGPPVPDQPGSIRIAIVDDHPVARYGMQVIFAAEPGLEVVQTADSLAALQAGHAGADVVILDLYLGRGRLPGPEIADVAARHAVLMVSASARRDDVLAAIRAGASGYLVKSSAGEAFVEAVRTVAAQGFYVSSQLADLIHTKDGVPEVAGEQVSLAPREREALSLIAQGFTQAQAASRMGISPATIDTYIKRIRSKLGPGNKADLTRRAIELGQMAGGSGAEP